MSDVRVVKRGLEADDVADGSKPQPTPPDLSGSAAAESNAGSHGKVTAKIASAIERTERLLLSRQAERLMVAFENIREGLGMYDAAERLVMMNPRYAEMYQVPPDLQRPGTPFATLLDYWRDISLLAGLESRQIRVEIEASKSGGNFRLHLFDGRTYEINEQPLPGGGWVSTHEDITDRVAAEQRILFLAEHDTLTGLFNRSVFQDRLQSLMGEPDQTGAQKPFALVLLDLNRFKPVNDLHGHAAGDQVLIEVARRLREVFGEATMIARLGGDEFAAILEHDDDADAIAMAERLITSIADPIAFGRLRLELGASIGIAQYPTDATNLTALLNCADRALYTAKRRADRPIVSYFSDLDADEIARVELIRRLPSALSNGEIELHFQPIVDAATGHCRTAEALLRWTHPERGRLSPEHVISVAEESRLIGPLGDWILRRALETAQTWPEEIAVAVNLSANQFKDPGFCAMVLDALQSAGMAPARLELELTETVLCSEEAIETIRTLRNIGVRFSLDDFGTGYASMSYLLQFPFDRVKIDRSFVTEVDERRDRRLIVEAVAGLACKLGLEIVAEGVETNAERQVVSGAGCRFLQGYLFARPLPAIEFLKFIERDEGDSQVCI